MRVFPGQYKQAATLCPRLTFRNRFASRWVAKGDAGWWYEEGRARHHDGVAQWAARRNQKTRQSGQSYAAGVDAHHR